MGNVKLTRDAFLWCISAVYLCAFASLYVQIPGLYGDNGILPARLILPKEANTWKELLEDRPTLLKLTPKLGLDAQGGMDLLCLGGILISFFCVVSRRARDMISFSLLWMFYLSLYQVGQTFLSFQWDILLLEAGFLTIIIAPLNLRLRSPTHHQHDNITLWLVKWLLFRLMFSSGIVKLTSQCPTWWGLTALDYHFESQCIPTPLAWYWHQLPSWFLKLSVVFTFIIEIAVPFLFFAPVRSLRIVAFYSQVLLQVLIIATGNYTFFNLLTLALCIPLLDDFFFSRRVGGKRRSSSYLWAGVGCIADYIVPVLVYGYLGYIMYEYFGLQVESDYSITSNITFSKREFNGWLQWIMPYTIYMGAISLAFEILISILRSLAEAKSFIRKSFSVIQCIIFGAVAVSMFSISLIPHTALEVKSRQLIWPKVVEWHNKLDSLEITNSYGLFRRMTGVGGRPEVIIEGSNKPDGGWKEYEFLYKPGKLSTRLAIVAPHQPRLDWQMWFAALGSYQHNPWFLNLVYRLLNNQKEVLELIHKNPFPGKPPKYIQASLYHYHYTSNNLSHDRYSKTNWWLRSKQAEYLSVMSKDTKLLVQYLKHYRILETVPISKSKSSCQSIISAIRTYIGQPEGLTFIVSIFGSGLIINLLNAFM